MNSGKEEEKKSAALSPIRAKLKPIRLPKPEKKSTSAIPARFRVSSPFETTIVDWKPVKLTLRDRIAFAHVWLSSKLDAFRNWRHEHLFMLNSLAILSFAVAYLLWMAFMHYTVQKTFREEPDEAYGKCFNIWDVYR